MKRIDRELRKKEIKLLTIKFKPEKLIGKGTEAIIAAVAALLVAKLAMAAVAAVVAALVVKLFFDAGGRVLCSQWKQSLPAVS